MAELPAQGEAKRSGAVQLLLGAIEALTIIGRTAEAAKLCSTVPTQAIATERSRC